MRIALHAIQPIGVGQYDTGHAEPPLFEVTFGRSDSEPGYGNVGVLDFLHVHLPHVAICEQVSTFGQADISGDVPIRAFIAKVSALRCPWSGDLWYIAKRVFAMNACDWIPMQRSRLFYVVVSLLGPVVSLSDSVGA